MYALLEQSKREASEVIQLVAASDPLLAAEPHDYQPRKADEEGPESFAPLVQLAQYLRQVRCSGYIGGRAGRGHS